MTLHLVQKLYTEAWDEEKTLFYPYSDSPELRRVAKAQEVLSDVSRLSCCPIRFWTCVWFRYNIFFWKKDFSDSRIGQYD